MNTNTLRRLNWLWKHRHTHDDDVETEQLTVIVGELQQQMGGTSQGTGAFIHLVRAATQSIDAAGEAIEFDGIGLLGHGGFGSPVIGDDGTTGAGPTPGTDIIIPTPGYWNVDILAGWVSFAEGGSVRVTRNGSVVWPPAADPGIWTATDGQLFEGTAHAIPCQAGDVLQVHIDPDDASAQDLASASATVYLVDRVGRSGGINPDLLWLDASDLTSTGALSSWTDKSGAGNTVSQGTGAAQPTVVAAAQNGLPVVRFDGNDDRLSRATAAATSSQPVTVFAVAKSTATTFPNIREIVGTYPGGGLRGSEFATDTSGRFRAKADTDGGAELDGGPHDTDWHIHEAVFDGASTVYLIDGVQVASGNAGTGGFTNGIGVGGAFDNGHQGDIAEIRAYGRSLSEADRATVRAALAAKWGL